MVVAPALGSDQSTSPLPRAKARVSFCVATTSRSPHRYTALASSPSISAPQRSL
jgi:hypothetical protein